MLLDITQNKSNVDKPSSWQDFVGSYTSKDADQALMPDGDYGKCKLKQNEWGGRERALVIIICHILSILSNHTHL